MLEHMLNYPGWLQVWIAWLGVANLSSVLFLRGVQARWVLVAFLGAGTLMSILFAVNGFNRLLGLAHIVFWTPLLIYLWRERTSLPPDGFRAWITMVIATNATSLVVDYTDVVRYLLGDRS